MTSYPTAINTRVVAVAGAVGLPAVCGRFSLNGAHKVKKFCLLSYLNLTESFAQELSCAK